MKMNTTFKNTTLLRSKFLILNSLMAQKMVCQGQADHGLANGHNTWYGRNVVAPAHLDFDRLVVQVQRFLLEADRGNGFDSSPNNYGIAV